MSPSLRKLARDKRLMAFTAAAMYGGAALDGGVEGLIPGDPSFAVAPVIAAGVIVSLLILAGPRLPLAALSLLGPIGVVLIAVALTATPGAGDGAVLYMWPVLWSTFFFGRRGAIAIVACVGVAHAIVLLELPGASSYPGRWVDVMVSVVVVAAVVLALLRRNDQLLVDLTAEARTDALTGLLNRRGFDERASLELARSKREESSIALAAFDLDHFKRVNDEWGHDVGDRVLIRTAQVLAAEAREIDVVARFGGEEFVALLPGADTAAAHAFAERVRDALAGERFSRLPTVRVSAGILAARTPATIDELLRGADSALYAAKRGGRDRAVVYRRDLHPAGEILAGRG
ncbi:MAG TPA: GGDEF domain-containing protein [Solirubrobacteraceae bacterium]|nr:GGDEF domain-containing protein [Solirubrobacteraceae bacterium]